MKPSFNIPKQILPIIIVSQFCCTSLWFAGNGVMANLVVDYNLEASALGHLTSAVQLGFIIGTLLFAVLSIVDRYAPSKVFFSSALMGAFFNLCVVWNGNSLLSILILRFFIGFFLAGIYPVGMKIAADYYEKGLGKSLGYLVGALVLGTAFPHLLKVVTASLAWQWVLVVTSILALIGGGLMLLFVPDGPYRRAGQQINLSSFFAVFKNKEFRAAAFGYFGHMWELYTFWAFIPVLLKMYLNEHSDVEFNIPLVSFAIIAIGSLACVLSGYLSQKNGTKRIALIALTLSCICCLITPMLFTITSAYLFVGFLLFWGMVVIADSPLFSTLVAQNAAPEIKGTALTIVNCIGFSITILSIQLITVLNDIVEDPKWLFVTLALGPILGIIALRRKQ